MIVDKNIWWPTLASEEWIQHDVVFLNSLKQFFLKRNAYMFVPR